MPQIKETVSNKFNEIELKIQEISYLANFKKFNFHPEFEVDFFDKIQEIVFLS